MKKLIAVISVFFLMMCNAYAADFGKEECMYTVLRRHNFFETNTADWIRSNNHIAGQDQNCATKHGVLTDADNDFFIKKNSAVKDAYISTRIYVEKSGTYYIWINTDNKPDGGNRSGYLWFDNPSLPSDSYNFNSAKTAQDKLKDSGWYWDRDNGTELSEGWHTLYMAADNANFRVALVVVTDDADENLLNLDVSKQYGDLLEPLTDIEKPVIRSLEGESESFNSLTLNFSADDNNIAAGYDIYLNGEYKETVGKDSETGYVIDNLLPLQNMKVKIIAYDLNGNKAESEEKSFIVSPVTITQLSIVTDDEIFITDKSQLSPGMNLNISLTLKNSAEETLGEDGQQITQQDFIAGMAFYSDVTGRMTSSCRKSGFVSCKNNGTVDFSLTVPENFAPADKVLITVWDSAENIMPLVQGIQW